MHTHIHTVNPNAPAVLLEASLSVSSMTDNEIENANTTERAKEMENLPLSMSNSASRFSRDLLRRFIGGDARDYAVVRREADDEIELNLRLSLGGNFGIERSSNTLLRSSSIASCLPVARDEADATAAPSLLPLGLARTSSLPVETEEQWRKRKELQSMRRMEAKRRRQEKQRNLKCDKETMVNLMGRLDRKKCLSEVKGWSSPAAPQFELSAREEAGDKVGIDLALVKGVQSNATRGLAEAKGGRALDLEMAERGAAGELSSASIRSLQETRIQGISSPSVNVGKHTSTMAGPGEVESPTDKAVAMRSQRREVWSNSIDDMPSVFTKGDGPNGRRVDGILYKYRIGEEVRIMCICHGTFHTPADFVKHAGGTDVDHPLKQIVVNPNLL